MFEWKEYNGSDEQIAEISNAKHGYILRGGYKPGTEACFTYSDKIHDYFVLDGPIKNYNVDYWIIQDDPLREMKVRQAMTGQPVWVKTTCTGYRPCEFGGDEMYSKPLIYSTTNPNWNIQNAEYSFTEFKG